MLHGQIQSMAVPHVAGLIAYFIGLYGNQSPSTMAATLQNCATRNALSGVRECLMSFGLSSDANMLSSKLRALSITLLIIVSSKVPRVEHITM